MDWPILSTIILIPLLGSLTILLINGEDEIGKRNIKIVALYASIVNFLASIFLWLNFDKLSPEFQFIERHAWLAENITYHVGIDGISLFLIILTTFLMPFCVLASWNSISIKIKDYILDRNERLLKKGQKTLKVTEKEINFICTLKNSKSPLSKKYILEKIWLYSPGTETHTIETHIYRLRQKVKEMFGDQTFIKNIKSGYIL